MVDANLARQKLQEDYLRTTGLAGQELSSADAVFDESAFSNVCPACGEQFGGSDEAVCPECGLRFGP